jgi:hypothetical protein
MNKKAVYMNFPITVLKGAFKDIRGTIEKIMYYAIYKHSLMYDFGDEAKNMKASADFYRVGLSDIETSIRYGREIYESIKKDTPSVSIDIEMLCSYYNTPKTEAESILGNKAYTKTNKSLISARMFGMAGSALANTQEQDYSTEQLMKKYSKRYHMDNILLELQTNYGLKLYSSHSRGFYLSFSKTIDDLTVISTESKLS